MPEATHDSLTTTPSSYLNYLPACFAEADPATGQAFLGLYLKAFEKLLSGIADGGELAAKGLDATVANRAGIRELLKATVIGDLFHPRWSFLFPGNDTDFIPKLSEATGADKAALFDSLASYFGLPQYPKSENEQGPLPPVEIWVRAFFVWLGGTVGLQVDKNWTIDAARKVTAQTFALDRARGTPMGMDWLLSAYLDAYPQPVKGVTLGGATVTDCTQPALFVFDSDTEITPAFRLRDAYPEAKDAVVISDMVGPMITCTTGARGTTFSVQDAQLWVAYVPWRFVVNVTISVSAGVKEVEEELALQAYCRALSRALDWAKPALTTYVLHFTVHGPAPHHSYSLWRSRRHRSDIDEDL